MSTPNPVQFPPLLKGFNWTLSTTGAGGAALPPGETESGVTIGVRLDGDSAHSPGNYQWLVPLGAGITSETAAELEAALAKLSNPPQPGANCWGAIDQTDMLNGSPSTSAWTAEVPFSIPFPIVQPAPPTGFTAS